MKPYKDFLRTGFRLPAIVAHRGAWAKAPENSLKSLIDAADQGFEIAEIDIRKTVDGGFVLVHDDTLDRMTGQPGMPEEHTIDALCQMPLRDRNGIGSESLTDQRIPRLEDALRVAHGRIYLDVDVKDEAHMAEVAALIALEGMSEFVNIKIDVENAEDVRRLYDLQHTYGVMVMPKVHFDEETADTLIALLAKAEVVIAETKFDDLKTLTRRKAAFAAAGLNIWINTLDPVAPSGFTDSRALEEPEAVWGRLMNAGATVFQTDVPEALRAYRETLNQPRAAS